MRHLYCLIISLALCCWSAAARAEENSNIPFFATYPYIDLGTWYLSHGWRNGIHQACEWRADAIDGKDGNLQITLSNHGGKISPVGCGELQSKKTYGYGRYEARMRTAAGSGLNTAFFTFIGPPNGVKEHDEIDFEFLGKDPTMVQLTYWSNSKQSSPVMHDLGFDASVAFHDYAFEWTAKSIKWFVDGQMVYETPEGAPMPRNRSKIFFSLWAGTQIQDAWLGPFRYKAPVNAEVAWVKYTPLP